ncbi:MAG: ABC transporter permease subunit [Armatimonadetes bacterium]|nr:ABC transporter permease subunit [Armatimonadota bacterium]
MLTIALFTWREAVRRRLLIVTVFLAVVFLGLYGIALYFANKEICAHAGPVAQKLFIPQFFTLGLYFGSFIVSFLAILAAVATISGEMESGVIYAVLARPIHRAELVFGKLLGNGLLLVFYAALFLLALFLLVHAVTGFTVSGVAPAVALFCLQPLILLSVTTLGSVLFSTLANGVVMFMLYAVAVVGGMVEQIGWFVHSETMQRIGIVASLVMPVDAVYRKLVRILLAAADSSGAALTQMGPFGAQSEPSVWMLVYTLLYMAGAVGLAVYAFNQKDIG